MEWILEYMGRVRTPPPLQYPPAPAPTTTSGWTCTFVALSAGRREVAPLSPSSMDVETTELGGGAQRER